MYRGTITNRLIVPKIFWKPATSPLRAADTNTNPNLFKNCTVISSSVFSQSMSISLLSWCRPVCPQLNVFTGAQLKQWADTHVWWRHQMETFSALLTLCAGNSSVTGEFPAQRPVKWRFDVLFFLIYAWINGWVKNSAAGDLRSHRPHYDVTVMESWSHPASVHGCNFCRRIYNTKYDNIPELHFVTYLAKCSFLLTKRL